MMELVARSADPRLIPSVVRESQGETQLHDRYSVLLGLHSHGWSLAYARAPPLSLAGLFLGSTGISFFSTRLRIVTNLFGGWIGSRVGLKITLFSGLATQVVALLTLSLVQQGWMELSVSWARRSLGSCQGSNH